MGPKVEQRTSSCGLGSVLKHTLLRRCSSTLSCGLPVGAQAHMSWGARDQVTLTHSEIEREKERERERGRRRGGQRAKGEREVRAS